MAEAAPLSEEQPPTQQALRQALLLILVKIAPRCGRHSTTPSLKPTASKLSMKDLTVLAPQNDPFRIDTPANHRDSKWLADVIADLGIRGQIHLRGLHYAISMAPKPFTKPDGTRYVNDDRNWDWMSAVAMKAARWLGYIPWDSVFDKRNAEPTIYEFAEPDPWPFLSIGLDITVPSVDQIQPYVGLSGFRGVQPYKVVMIGEKSSLEDIPAASRSAARRGPVPADREHLRLDGVQDRQERRR
jgi:hypothetical protein